MKICELKISFHCHPMLPYFRLTYKSWNVSESQWNFCLHRDLSYLFRKKFKFIYLQFFKLLFIIFYVERLFIRKNKIEIFDATISLIFSKLIPISVCVACKKNIVRRDKQRNSEISHLYRSFYVRPAYIFFFLVKLPDFSYLTPSRVDFWLLHLSSARILILLGVNDNIFIKHENVEMKATTRWIELSSKECLEAKPSADE